MRKRIAINKGSLSFTSHSLFEPNVRPKCVYYPIVDDFEYRKLVAFKNKI